MHSTFGFVISVTENIVCPHNSLYYYYHLKIVVCKNKISISVTPLSQKF